MKAKSNSGWKGQSLRHSNAKKHGRAGGTYSSVGKDFWGRKTYSKNGKVYKEVDGVLHTTTAEGEPLSPVKDSVGMTFATEKELNDYMKGKNTSQKLTPKELSYAKKLISKADRLQLAELREETTEANIKRTSQNTHEQNKKEQEEYERMSGGYERNKKTGKIRATMKYGSFGKTHDEEAKDKY